MAAKSTTKSPQQKNGKDDKNHKKGLMAFAIVISLILAVCIVANIVYCYKRKVNEKIAGQILEHQVSAQEGGIDEIALDPMADNFGPNVSAQNSNGAKKAIKRRNM